MYVCMYACLSLCLSVGLYVCMCISVHVGVCRHAYVQPHATRIMHVNRSVHICIVMFMLAVHIERPSLVDVGV